MKVQSYNNDSFVTFSHYNAGRQGLLKYVTKALAVGPEKSYSVCIGQADFENDCEVNNYSSRFKLRGTGGERNTAGKLDTPRGETG